MSESKKNLFLLFLLIIAIVSVGSEALLWVAGHGKFFGSSPLDVNQSQNWGNFGSYLQGTTGSLFALAGFLVIFVAFLVQYDQLKDQKEELKDQKAQIQRQNFESSLFELLNLQNEIVKDLSGEEEHRVLEHGGYALHYTPTNGRLCFKKWYKRDLQDAYIAKPIAVDEDKRIEAAWAKFFEKTQDSIGHYFLHLYHVLNFIDASGMPDKRPYTRIVRAQLSQYELLLLFYNCLQPANRSFHDLVVKYGLLKSIAKELLLNKDSHAMKYADSAYQ